MLLDPDTNPKYDLYYIGGLVLRHYQDLGVQQLDFSDLYMALKTKHGVSPSLLILALDFLFMIDCLKLSNRGDLLLCS
jgi:hypothetical protein